MRRIIILLCTLTAQPSFASNSCHDLWFSRNQIIDQTSYCFKSNLGKAIFDNSDCSPNGGMLTKMDRDAVAWIKRFETEQQCDVDTSRTTLDLDLIDLRHKITTPIAYGQSEYIEADCISWVGDTAPLMQSPHASSPQIGEIQVGDDVSMDHHVFSTGSDVEWHFYVSSRNGDPISLGFSPLTFDDGVCKMIAG